MRLIDADTAIRTLEDGRYSPDYCKEHGIDYSISMEMVRILLNTLPSEQPDIIYCKDCIYQTESWSGIKYCEAHGDHIGKDYDYCSNARRKENG